MYTPVFTIIMMLTWVIRWCTYNYVPACTNSAMILWRDNSHRGTNVLNTEGIILYLHRLHGGLRHDALGHFGVTICYRLIQVPVMACFFNLHILSQYFLTFCNI